MSALVFTDLDGTLLDHETYRADEAKPGIELLQSLNVPIIPVSSKTRAEIEPLMSELGWHAPFIVENGAAVFLPESICSKRDSLLPSRAEYRYQNFAPILDEWQPIIRALQAELPQAFIPFSALSVEQISEVTGLNAEQAAQASQREFSDPLHWRGSETDFQLLQQLCNDRQIDVVRGGRFVHLLKGSDKGRAVCWLSDWFTSNQGERPVTVALGDGENDLSMLAVVDYPVQIRSASHTFPEFNHPACYQTRELGPKGWTEAIAALSGRLN